MLAFKIIGIKDFMNKLLMEEVFDKFLLVSFEISNSATITIDGIKNKEWYDEEKSGERYVKWMEMRETAASLIKGNKAPLSIKAIFRLSKENTLKMAAELRIKQAEAEEYGMFFNLRYEKDELNIVTGVSVADFMKAKELGNLWDDYLLRFLKYYQIAAEVL